MKAEGLASKNKGMRKTKVFIFFAVVMLLLYYVLVYFNVITIQTASKSFYAVVFGVVLIELIGKIISYYMSVNVYKAEADTLADLFRIFAYCILILLLLSLAGVNLSTILVSAGFLGIVFGLAAQSTLSNFIAGIYLLASSALEPEDHVIIHTWQYTMNPQSYPHDKFVPGFAGTVEYIGVLYTKLINEEGLPVFVPNNFVAQSLFINYRKAKEHSHKIQFDVAMSVPFEVLKDITKKAMKEEKIKQFDTEISYVHTDLYVVTIHFNTTDIETRGLKSRILSKIVRYLGKARKTKTIRF